MTSYTYAEEHPISRDVLSTILRAGVAYETVTWASAGLPLPGPMSRSGRAPRAATRGKLPRKAPGGRRPGVPPAAVIAVGATREIVKTMKPGAVIVDIAIDQGGTTRPPAVQRILIRPMWKIA
jgi:alanine dehydrogenase